MLVIFDIDGTLTHTNGDWSYYKQVFGAQFGVAERTISDNFDHYPHITDSGVFRTLCERHGVSTTPECYPKFVASYLQAMQSIPVMPIPGAADLLVHIKESPIPFAVATGAFVQKALSRLKMVGIHDPVPMATADDHTVRHEIMKISRARAEQSSSDRFTEIVYVGDALWDVRACAKLGWRFVARTANPEIFQPFGVPAQCTVPDYSDIARFHCALRHARVPQRC